MAADLIVQVLAQMDEFKAEIDDAAGSVEDFSERGGGAMAALNDNIGTISVAAAGAAAGIEALARSQQDTRKSILDLGDATDLTEEQITEMASSMSNATISADEVVGLFVRAREQGLKTREELEEFATFWDMVGDASGENAEQLAGAGRALRAVGIAAGDEQEAIGAMGFVLQETTGSVEGFLNFVERTSRELGDSTPSIDDMAAALGGLEERGFSSQVAQRELQKALRETDGDFEAAIEILGITAGQFDELRAQVDASGDVMAQRSENFAETRTRMEEIQAAVGGVLLEWAPLVSTVAEFAPAMLAVSTALPLASKAMTGLKIAMAAALSPIGLVVAAIAAAAAIAFVLWQNWDEVTALVQGIWESLKIRAEEIFRAIETAINNFVTSVTGFFIDLKNDVVQLVIDLKDAVIDHFTGMFTGAVDTVKDMASGVTGWLGDMADTLVGNSIIPDMVEDVLRAFDDMRMGSIVQAQDMASGVIDETQTMADSLVRIGEQLGIDWLTNIGQMVGGTIDSISTMVTDIRSLFSDLGEIFDSVSGLFGGGGGGNGGGFIEGLSSFFGGGSGGSSGGGGSLSNVTSAISAGKTISGLFSGGGGLSGALGALKGSGALGAVEAGTGATASTGASSLAAAAPAAAVIAVPTIIGPAFDKLVSGDGFAAMQANALQDLQTAGPAVGGGLGLQAAAGQDFSFAAGANAGFAAEFAQMQGFSDVVFELGENLQAFKGVTLPETLEILDQAERKFEDLKARGAEMFADLGVSATEMGDILRDGVIDQADKAALSLEHIGTVIENPKTGMKELGDISLEQFDLISAAIERGELRLEALQGQALLSQDEMRLLGEIGVGASSDIVAGTHQAEGALKSMGRSGSVVMSQIGQGGETGARVFSAAFEQASNDAIGGMHRLRDESTGALASIGSAAGAAAQQVSNLPHLAQAAANSARRSLGSVQAPRVNIPGLAHGAIVTRPTLAMIGEGGEHEAVFPLSRLDEFLSGRGRGEGLTVNLTQNIQGVTPDEVEQQTRRAFRRVAAEWAIAS